MTKTAVFTMGLPGAGKSTVRDRMFPGATIIDPDAIKAEHPDYDPANAFLVHDWSTDEAERRMIAAFTTQQDGVVIVDGTGTSADSMVRKMNYAASFGWSIRLVYVKVSVETSLKRCAARTRRVPESIIRDKARSIDTSFALVSPFAGEVTVINND